MLFFQCQYGQQPWCNQLQALVKIVLNTLDMQHHQCRRIPATVVMAAPPSRSRGKNLKISNKKYNVSYRVIYIQNNYFRCISTLTRNGARIDNECNGRDGHGNSANARINGLSASTESWRDTRTNGDALGRK